MPSPRMTTALIVGGVVAAVYVGILLLLWHFQERIVFQPPVNPESPHAGTRTLSYTSSDGIRLIAHVVEAERPGGPTVLVFHGNAMISRWMIPWAQEVSRRFNATVVLPEYRGYDGLAGIPTYEGAALDAQAALDAVRQHYRLSAGELVYYGHSLGTAVATELAASAPPRSLVLESPFTSARDMAARWPIVGLGFFWGAISRVHYDTHRRVATVDVPVHVAHGDRDIIIPVRMGQAVHAVARRPGQLLIVSEAGHNDVAPAGGEGYWRWLQAALQSSAK
jgi:pimeloyl-ACP methyl ester carboxylesterase